MASTESVAIVDPCGVCKSKTAVKRLKCVKCEVYYHSSCVERLKSAILLSNGQLLCCDTKTGSKLTVANMGAELNVETITVSQTKVLHMEIDYLREIIKSKDALIQEVQEKNAFLMELLSSQAVYTPKTENLPVKFAVKESAKPSAAEEKLHKMKKAPVMKQNTLKLNVQENKGNADDRNGQISAPSPNLNRKHKQGNPTESKSPLEQENSTNGDEGFIFPRKYRKQKVVFGTKKDDDLTGYLPKSQIHVSKLNLEVTGEQVKKYITKQIPECSDVTFEELKVKSNAYRSFKVSVPATFKNVVLQSEFWPDNIAVKPYRDLNFQRRMPPSVTT